MVGSVIRVASNVNHWAGSTFGYTLTCTRQTAMLCGMKSQPQGRTGPSLAQQVAAEIRAELGRQNLTMNAFAAHLEVTYPWLWRRLRAEQPMTLEDLEKIGDGLGVRAEELIARAVALRSAVTVQFPSGVLGEHRAAGMLSRPPSYPMARAGQGTWERRPVRRSVAA